MAPSRLAKSLLRRAMVSWREEPTRYDIEALQANTERVGLVIRVRWALVAALAGFSLLGGWVYSLEVPWSDLVMNMRVPALAVIFVVLYNIYYSLTYRRLGNIAFLNHAQLLFDVIVVTVLVYYSGGVHSWFYAMYALFVLEAAFILPRVRDAWIVALFCAVAYGVVVWGEFFGILPHVEIPFTEGELHFSRTYVGVRYLWQITVLAVTGMVATRMTAAVRERESELAASTIVDDKTGLYDRKYFLRALSSELLRAERDGRPLWVLMVDIDSFGRFNRLFGIPAGDRMIGSVAEALTSALDTCVSTPAQSTNVLARFGGEEFAILLAEGCSGDTPGRDDAELVAEAVRTAVAELRLDEAGVTVSIGGASYPEHGPTADTLLASADEALHAAATSGGNRIVLAGADS